MPCRGHTMVFENQNTNKIGEMRSALSEDALNIFKVLGVSTDHSTSFQA